MAKNDFIINGQAPASEFTKREKIAAMAMQAIITSNPDYLHGNTPLAVPDTVAVAAVDYADALIKQLEV